MCLSRECSPGSGQERRRKFVTGDEGVRLLCLGGVPGQAYEPPGWTEEGGAVPLKDELAEEAIHH